MKQELIEALSDCIEGQLSVEYEKRGITTGDISLEESLLWDNLVEQFADLFSQLIKHNTHS